MSSENILEQEDAIEELSKKYDLMPLFGNREYSMFMKDLNKLVNCRAALPSGVEELRAIVCMKLGYDDGIKGRQDLLVTEGDVDTLMQLIQQQTDKARHEEVSQFIVYLDPISVLSESVRNVILPYYYARQAQLSPHSTNSKEGN